MDTKLKMAADCVESSGDIEHSLRQEIEKTIPEGVSISEETLKRTYLLAEGRLDYPRVIQSKQDEAMAERIGKASAVPMPLNIKTGEFISVPLDIMVFKNPENGQDNFVCIEFNSMGFGGMFKLPQYVLQTMQVTLNRMGAKFKNNPDTLILIGSSGRQRPIDPDVPEKLMPSCLIFEKIWLADGIAEEMRKPPITENVEVVSFHDPKNFGKWIKERNSSWISSSKPVIIVGYTREFVESSEMKVEDGVPYFYGRRVTGIVNDRFISNLQAAHGKLDPKKFLSSNITSHVGTDKMAAYLVANEYNLGAGKAFPACSRKISAEHAYDADQLVTRIRAFLDAGMRAIIKPNNTGWGHGIEVFLDKEEDDMSMREKIKSSLREVNENYNKKTTVAGFPYTVTEYFDANKIDAPDKSSPYHYAHDRKYELRVAVYADYTDKVPTLKACPHFLKLNLEPSSKVCNAATQSLISGRPYTDYMLPFCTEDIFKLMGVTEEQITDLCKWSTGYVAHALSRAS